MDRSTAVSPKNPSMPFLLRHVFDRNDMHLIRFTNRKGGTETVEVGTYCLRCHEWVRDPNNMTQKATPLLCSAPPRFEERH